MILEYVFDLLLRGNRIDLFSARPLATFSLFQPTNEINEFNELSLLKDLIRIFR